jgi:hypothetical protein
MTHQRVLVIALEDAATSKSVAVGAARVVMVQGVSRVNVPQVLEQSTPPPADSSAP